MSFIVARYTQSRRQFSNKLKDWNNWLNINAA